MKMKYLRLLIPDWRYHSPDCTDRVTSHTWEVSGLACGTFGEIEYAPEYLRKQWKKDRVRELRVHRIQERIYDA